jgi:hypothetical protein
MALVGDIHRDLAGGGAAKALLGTALCLQLGHVNIQIEARLISAPGGESKRPAATINGCSGEKPPAAPAAGLQRRLSLRLYASQARAAKVTGGLWFFIGLHHAA